MIKLFLHVGPDNIIKAITLEGEKFPRAYGTVHEVEVSTDVEDSPDFEDSPAFEVGATFEAPVSTVSKPARKRAAKPELEE
jgi:hypothetical protein